MVVLNFINGCNYAYSLVVNETAVLSSGVKHSLLRYYPISMPISDGKTIVVRLTLSSSFSFYHYYFVFLLLLLLLLWGCGSSGAFLCPTYNEF